jgi:hypothetical protein
LVVIGVAAALVAGCDKEPQALATPVAPAVAMGSGVVRGHVTFAGTPPVMGVIANKPCHHGAPEQLTEETVVVTDGKLANVFVYVKDAPNMDAPMAEPAMLDQVHCRYEPHAVGVRVRQTLRIRSSDDTMHNVHYNPSENKPANFGFTQAGAEKTVRFAHAEFMRVKCDVHPWMTAYVGVFESPFFAVTTETREFEIKGLPAGTYTLATWHELLGEQEQTITVSDGQSAVTANFEYKGPSTN